MLDKKTREAIKRMRETFNGFAAGLRGAKMRGEMRDDQRMTGDFEWAYAEGEAARLRIVEDVAEAILTGDVTRVIDTQAIRREYVEGLKRNPAPGLQGTQGENPVHELLYYVARLDYAAERMLWAVAEGDEERITQRASRLEEARLIQPNLRMAIDQARHEVESKLRDDEEEASGWGDPTKEHPPPTAEGGNHGND